MNDDNILLTQRQLNLKAVVWRNFKSNQMVKISSSDQLEEHFITVYPVAWHIVVYEEDNAQCPTMADLRLAWVISALLLAPLWVSALLDGGHFVILDADNPSPAGSLDICPNPSSWDSFVR